jgi:uncharacterized membrane protein
MPAQESKIFSDDLHARVPITRLQILADVIFAASMVFMASAFELPDTDIVDSPGELANFLKGQLPVVAIYVISFILVAVYWMKHLEHFSYLKKTNIGHLWLQILFLAMVVIIPYSNALSSAAPDTLAFQTFYSINMFLVGLFSLLSWIYATRDHRLTEPDLELSTIRHLRNEAMVEPAIALVSIGAARIGPALWELTLLLIPVAYIAQKKIDEWYLARARRRASQ